MTCQAEHTGWRGAQCRQKPVTTVLLILLCSGFLPFQHSSGCCVLKGLRFHLLVGVLDIGAARLGVLCLLLASEGGDVALLTRVTALS